MSDEPNTNDKGTEWTMPEPVFRSSEGRTPKTATSPVDPDDIDTESPDFDESDAAEILTESPDLDEIEADDIDTEIPNLAVSEVNEENTPVPDETLANTVRAAPAVKPKTKGGCAKNFLMIVGVIVFAAVAVIITAVYFLFYFRPAETGTF